VVERTTKKKRCKLNTEHFRMRIQKKNNNMREKRGNAFKTGYVAKIFS